MVDKKRGVTDMSLKEEGLLRLIGGGSRSDLLYAVLANREPNEKKYPNREALQKAEQAHDDLIQKTYKSFTTWAKGSRPKIGSDRARDEFWHDLPEFLGNQTVTAQVLLDSTFEEFASFIPDRNRRATFLHERLSSQHTGEDTQSSDNLNWMKASASPWSAFINMTAPAIIVEPSPMDADSERFEDAHKRDRLDQRLLWRHRQSAENWERCTLDDTYKTYSDCKNALSQTLHDARFLRHYRRVEPTRVVMLGGGGSHSKDLLMLRHLCSEDERFRADNRLEYVLLDASHEMLISSARSLYRHAKRGFPWAKRSYPRFVAADMLSLGNCRELFHKEERATLFTMTGGTLGNLPEKDFLRSLNTVAKFGDLLMLGVSTFDNTQCLDRDRAIALKAYRSDAIRQLFSHSVSGYLLANTDPESLADVMATNKVDVVEGTANFASQVPGTRSVEYSVRIKRRRDRLVVVNHTKYTREAFEAFAKPMGWGMAETFASPDRPGFAYFLLQRVPKD